MSPGTLPDLLPAVSAMQILRLSSGCPRQGRRTFAVAQKRNDRQTAADVLARLCDAYSEIGQLVSPSFKEPWKPNSAGHAIQMMLPVQASRHTGQRQRAVVGASRVACPKLLPAARANRRAVKLPS